MLDEQSENNQYNTIEKPKKSVLMSKKTIIISIAAVLLTAAGIVAAIYLINKVSADANTITCSSNGESDGLTIKQEYSIRFSESLITNVTIKKSYSFDDQDRFDTFGTVIDNTASNMSSVTNDYITYDSNESGKTYSSKLTVDVTKATDEELESLAIDKDLDTYKANLESNGLECK